MEIHARWWRVLVAQLLMTCALAWSACSPSRNLPPTQTRLALSRAIVMERLVSIGFERAQAANAVAKLPPQQLAALAASLGTPFAPRWQLEITCLLFLLLVLAIFALACVSL